MVAKAGQGLVQRLGDVLKAVARLLDARVVPMSVLGNRDYGLMALYLALGGR